MKIFTQVAGNRMFQRKVFDRITLEVNAKKSQREAELHFLSAMVRELEEKYRIELRKKAILKN